MEEEIDYSKYKFVEEKKNKGIQLHVYFWNIPKYLLWRGLCKKKGWNQSQIIRNVIDEYITKAIKEDEK